MGYHPISNHISYPDTETGEISYQAIQREVSQAVFNAAEALARAGAEIIENVPMPNSRFGIPAYFVISRVEAASNSTVSTASNTAFAPPNPSMISVNSSPFTRRRFSAFSPNCASSWACMFLPPNTPRNYYQRALKVRAMICKDLTDAFNPKGAYRLDALLTPTTPTTAFKRNDVFGNTVLMQYSDQMTVCANHAGMPAITIPGGLDQAGLPIGIQFIANDFREDLLFRAGRAFETATASAAWRAIKPIVLSNQQVIS